MSDLGVVQNSSGPRRLRIIVGLVALAVVVLLLSLRSIAGFYTDYLWFDSLSYSSVWSGVLWAKIQLVVVFVGLMFILMFVNLFIADRIAPAFRPPGPEEEFVRRYHETAGARPGLVRVGVAALFGLMLGAGAGTRWQDWILFRNSQSFGLRDPQFDVDVGFYVFELPFIRFVINWLFTAFLVVLIITAAAHYLNGGIRLNAPVQRVTPAVKGHLSVLLGVLALIKAADYWYQRYALNFSDRGFVDGAGYTDINAQLPAIKLLILISLAAVALLIANIWRRGWVLPVVAVGLWAFVAVVIGSIYPAIYQRLVVDPNESSRESAFIERNIGATRAAYGLGEVTERGYNPAEEDILTRDLLDANIDTLENIRLIDPAIVAPTFEQLQEERDQFRFNDDLDVDRYVIDGEERPVIIATRELNLGGVGSGWENQHIAFTHGYGVALAPANTVTSQGEPDFVVGDLPVDIDANRTDLTIDQPRLYIGEGLSGYAIVASDRCEVDFPLEGSGSDQDADVVDADEVDCASARGDNQLFSYDGDDGVAAGGLIRRLAFALRFQDLNPVFSGLINDDSKFIYNRDVRSRVRELAPFLDFDADSYPVIVDGRIKFVTDAYTTTSAYPYSQRADTQSVASGSDLRGGYNYVRNSVKVVVDAYDGDVTFYIIDESDPIIRAYQQAFPDLFTSQDEISDELMAHFRYPEDLFTVQTNMWGRYQLGEPDVFYEANGAWVVALDPGTELATNNAPTTQVVNGVATVVTGDRIAPYYLQMALPDGTGGDPLRLEQDGQEFVLMRPFVPRSDTDGRQELTALMFARVAEDGRTTELVSYELGDQDSDGPVLANRSMLSDNTVAETTTLLGSTGSEIRLGNTLPIPLDGVGGDPDALVWLRPLYVEQSSGQFPLVRNIIAYYESGTRATVRICPSVGLVLGALLLSESEVGEDCRNVESIFDNDVAVVDPDDPAGEDPDPESVPTPTAEATPTTGPTPTPQPTSPPPPQNAQELLERAQELFDEADAALAAGDLGTYQELITEGQALLDEALDLIAQATSVQVPTPAPEPTPEN